MLFTHTNALENLVYLRPIRFAFCKLNTGIRRLVKQAVFTLNLLPQKLQTQIYQRAIAQRCLHRYGYYYAPILCNSWIELLILQWGMGTDAKPHSHGASINFTKVLSGAMLERKYHVSGGQLQLISERVIYPGQWAWTLPFEIHDLVALDSAAETMHIYFPGRVCLAKMQEAVMANS